MRLECIKLAGFKSFVEPTVVKFPSQLSAIVGPNGCGKSNIIDAVRWVMGESSAKHLRGESLTDVIFNGSTARKPVGQASIELIFDNSEGKLIGQYAGFQEISIKRKVTREGVSSYYLNNTKCRRRDITDIFLGTGLGPRSYAIIEQGMISRLVEAKPDELRHYLEEAAGISKYKERRRETENRINHTRENLDRLNDIREELDRQLQHLQRQAKAAEKYKILKQEQGTLKAQLSAMRWQSLELDNQQLQEAIKQIQIDLEANIAKQRQVETNIEKQRLQFSEKQDEFNQIQGEYYRIGSDIARLEQSIEHHRERRKQLKLDLQQAESGVSDAKRHLTDDETNLAHVMQQLAETTPRIDENLQQEQRDAQKLTACDQELQQWQQKWDEMNQSIAEATRIAQVEQTNIQHAEHNIEQFNKRIEKLQQTNEELIEVDEDATLVQNIQILDVQLQEQEQQRSTLIDELNQHKQSLTTHTINVEQTKEALQKLRGQQASIEALQQQSLNKSSNGLIQWLNEHSLTNQPRFYAKINVEHGWEKAVEVVLANYLEAICVDSLSLITNLMDRLPATKLRFYEMVASSDHIANSKFQAITTVIKSDIELPALLDNIYLAPSLNYALEHRQELNNDESFITSEGHWIGKHWLEWYAKAKEDGVLYRKQLLEELSQTIQEKQDILLQQEGQCQQIKDVIEQSDMALEAMRVSLQNLHATHAQYQAELKAKQSQREHIQSQKRRTQDELDQAQHQIAEQTQKLANARHAWQEALSLLEQQTQEKTVLQTQRDQLRTELEKLRQTHQESRDQHHKIMLQYQDLNGKKNALEISIERLTGQVHQFEQRKSDIEIQLNQDETPVETYELQLKDKLAVHVQTEERLTQTRKLFEQADADLRQFEQDRLQFENQINEIREVLNQKRMDSQSLVVRQKTIEEQLNETEFDLQTVLSTLPPEADIEHWTQELEAIAQRIQRLGAINLAAIDELSSESERKNYLDQQYEDLIESLKTLEAAIEKIDSETKTRFKETFTTVNESLEKLFPKVFGGGQASLVMVENDLLNTGVELIARPPGKRNSTIHLLSGGEKALTAIALIFAIFQLNPSPFCMLDEVDAPLDDFNVDRYAKLIQEMSDKVQFIFITHNKLTMEIANHLLGVTMHEPGVSRLVAVDVDEAVNMATA